MGRHIIFLIAALSIISASADVFTSIDCGSSDAYTDENLVVWSGDDDYIQNGESYSVQTNSISTVMDTLRVFTSTRTKNCYSVEATMGSPILIRASFYYGNYDNKSSPPSFDLLYDANFWVTVETTNTGFLYFEVTYVAKTDSVSVCVAQTKEGQFPFISALEFRVLLPTMYAHLSPNHPLHLIRRVAYGANGTIRYADDPYDRIWTPAASGTGLTTVANEALIFGRSARDEPPPAVLMNAITAVRPNASIQLNTGFPPVNISVYFNMYFSEVTQLEATQKRSFEIRMDGVSLLDFPIIPPFENCTQIYGSNFTVSSNTTLLLVPTNDSTLPPLINAMEVFLIGDALSNGTNTKDVEGLASLTKAFAALQDWNGDPCLPSPYSWDWINCSSDATPRVTALYLSSFDLSGEIPDFSSMDALQTIDFHNNSLTGPIPEFLAAFPNLKQLNLASNQLNGAIPNSLSKKTGLNLEVAGNPDLCKSGDTCTTGTGSSGPGVISRGSGGKKKKSKLPVILGTTIPIFIVVWAIIGTFIALNHRRKAAAVAALSSGANRAQMNEMKVNMDDQSNVEMSDHTYNHGYSHTS